MIDQLSNVIIVNLIHMKSLRKIGQEKYLILEIVYIIKHILIIWSIIIQVKTSTFFLKNCNKIVQESIIITINNIII